MQLGFVSAILGDFSLDEVLAFAADEGFSCIEPMRRPPNGSDRRYTGVSHIDVTNLNDDQAGRIRDLSSKHGVALSGLGYYPNPLDPDAEHRRIVIEHLKKVINAAPRLGVGIVNTFIGKDHTKSTEANWPMFRSVWPDIVKHAEAVGVSLGLENCPMLFSQNDWPGGKNLTTSPAIWRTIFNEIPSPRLGLNFDPSHLIWQQIDYVRCVREFGSAHRSRPRQGHPHRP